MNEYNKYDPESGYEQTTVFTGRDDLHVANGVGDYVSSLSEALTNEVVSKSFLFMFVALVITAFAALTVDAESAISVLTGGGIILLVAVEFAVVVSSNKAIENNHAVLAAILYTVYAYLNGYTLSIILALYTESSIAQVFVVSAVMFLVMAVFGLITKKDLTSFGSLLMMALIGILIACFLNLLIFKSTGFDLILSIIFVLSFTGLTAYDTQKIKEHAAHASDERVITLALFSGFQLYLDFINLFIRLLRILGKRK